ncbi:MlaA family lipoprotein [Acinetobacter schindleri]
MIINRKLFCFNIFLDKSIIKPIIKQYKASTKYKITTLLTIFFKNT